MRKQIALFISLFFGFATASLAQSNNGNGGGVRISFGNDAEYVEPKTLSGDDPAVPPMPKRTFNTNSILLNQLLEASDNFDRFNQTLEKFQNNQKLTLESGDNCRSCFLAVYNIATKEIVAVLDKGTGKRVNLLNNKFETNDLYSSDAYGKIWFQLDE